MVPTFLAVKFPWIFQHLFSFFLFFLQENPRNKFFFAVNAVTILEMKNQGTMFPLNFEKRGHFFKFQDQSQYHAYAKFM